MYPYLRCSEPSCGEVADLDSDLCTFHRSSPAWDNGVIRGIVERALPYGVKVVEREGTKVVVPRIAAEFERAVPFVRRVPLLSLVVRRALRHG